MKRTVVHVTAGRWPGTLVIVTETKPWGVQGYIPLPDHEDDGTDRGRDVVGRAFVRVVNGAFTIVGEIDITEGDPDAGG